MKKSWPQHPTRHQLYGHLPPITKTIQVRRTRHAGHCWRSRDVLIRDLLLWTPSYGRGKAGRPARTYIQQLCEDTGCNPEDLPEAMNDREEVATEGPGYPFWWHDMMMVMILTKVCMTAILLMSPRLLRIFLPIFTMPWSVKSQFFLWYLDRPVLLRLWEQFLVHLVQLVPLSQEYF